MRLDSIITCDGLSVAGAASKTPSEAKAGAPERMLPKSSKPALMCASPDPDKHWPFSGTTLKCRCPAIGSPIRSCPATLALSLA